ncbi:MAG: Trm112 family protein [Candidatus Omnitrophica bacterium]|nr:Trm112 family protein [Candidatus Omnitrophota bacterium]
MIDKELLEILACPACKAAVREEGERIVCTSPSCGLRYPVREGIPVMLVEEAEKPKG